MGLIREPKEIDFSMKSEPWTEEELKDFRALMAKLKKKELRKYDAQEHNRVGSSSSLVLP